MCDEMVNMHMHMHINIQTMTPDQAAFVIQQAWRNHKFYYDYCDYEDEISFYDMYPDRPMDYEGMSQVNFEY